MNLDLNIQIDKEKTDFDINTDNFKDSLSYLVSIDKVYPLDLQYVERGHTMLKYRKDWNDYSFSTGAIVGVSKGSNCEFYFQPDKWKHAGKLIFETLLREKERVDIWESRLNDYVSQMRKYIADLKLANIQTIEKKELFNFLQTFLYIEAAYSFYVSEQFIISLGGYANQKLDEIFDQKKIKSSTVIPALVTKYYIGPAAKYNRGLEKIAKKCEEANIKHVILSDDLDKDINGDLVSLTNEFGWIRGSLNAPGLELKDVANDLNGVLQGHDSKRDVDSEDKEKEQLDVVQSSFSESEKNILDLVVKLTAGGSLLIDTWLEMVVNTNKVFDEISRRLKVNVIDLKHLLLEEVEEIFVNGKEINNNIISERKNGYVLVFNEGKITIHVEEKAIKIKQVLETTKNESKTDVLKGQTAFEGKTVVGKVKIVNSPEDMGKVNAGDILVSSATYPTLLPAMRRSAAIISELGGLLSHAAISSRELRIPCIVGVKGATYLLRDDDMVEVDTETGTVNRK